MKNSWLLLILFFIGFSVSTPGQSPYTFDRSQEAILLGASATLWGTGTILHRKIKPLTRTDILQLNRNSIYEFDISATYNHSIMANTGSDIGLVSSYFLPLLFLTHDKSRGDFKSILMLYGESILAVKGITKFTKRMAKRPRPFVFNELVPLSRKQKLSARFSFFSGHTSITATNSFFFARVFSDYFPESKLRPFIWSTAILLPAVTGHFRVRAGKHYPSDVITGYLVGASIGYFIPLLHKDKNTSLGSRWHLNVTSNDISLSYIF